MNKIVISLTCFAFLMGLSGSVGAATTVTGCGTLSNAGETYVLQNDISASGTCITIGADNIILDGAGYSITGSGSDSGVSLYSRSGITVKNLNVSGFSYGIYLYSSSNNTLTNNNVSNNGNGIFFRSSSNNTLTNNNVSNNHGGIFLYSSNNYNTLTNNTASNNTYGISIGSSSNNTLTGNAMNSNTYNFYLSGGQDSHFDNSIDTSNTVDGKPIYYVRNAANIVYSNSTNAGTFYCISCDNVTIKDLTLTKNEYGVFFWSTNNSKIENVNASDNEHGIYLFSSSNNTLTNSNASNKFLGIYLTSSSNNILTNNTASNNRYGIYLSYSSSNTLYNNFLNNTNNFAFTGTNTNVWNTAKTSGTNIIGGPYLGGNFWAKPNGMGFSETCTDSDGDGICDSSYTLTSGNVDFLPLSLNFVPPTTTTTSTTTTTTTTSTTTTTTTTTTSTTTTTTSTTTTTVPSQTTVAIDNAVAPPTRNTTVFLTIENVLDVGVADITLAYDWSVVQVLNVTTGDFDFLDAAIDNANGITRTGAMQMTNPGLNGSVTLANITLKAVGSIGECSTLNLSINELKAVGPPEADISATVVNGMFCIEETTPPSVTNPSAHPQSIPEDTDNNPTCAGTPYSEVSQLNVTVIDDSGVLGVTANLSAIGGQHDQPMSNISDTWTIATNASIGSAIYNGTDYMPHYLQVNATDMYNNTNSSISIPLTVIKNGDVNEDGDTTLYDAMYLARNVLGKQGFETITPGVADVSGDCSKTLYDAMYLAKNVLGKPGFETLR